MFWLSHHPPEELDRTFAWGRVHLCARCLGTYPVLVAALGVQFALGVPLVLGADGWVAVGGLMPALMDWAYGRFRPHAGSNLWRLGTGMALGLSLGRTLYVHVQSPWPLWLNVQLALVTAVVLPVMVARLRWKKGD